MRDLDVTIPSSPYTHSITCSSTPTHHNSHLSTPKIFKMAYV